MYDVEDDLDAVFVVLPPFAHEDQETMAAERGIDLFVEKPLALSNAKAREIREAIADNGVIGAVGYQRRYADATRRALDLVEGRAIGLVEGYYKSGVPGGPDHWWRDYERSGGQVVEQATHIYDLVRRFGGEVESVSAVGGHELVEEIDFEDVVSTNLAQAGGTVGRVVSTSAAPGFASGIELLGEDIHLSLSGNSLSGVVDGEAIDYEGDNDPDAEVVEAFVEAVRTRDAGLVRSTYADATRSLAVEESLDSGGAVEP
jgi:predicted dehydrogenase